MTSEQQHGVVFPRSADGRRSTSALGRAVLADALRAADPAGARSAEQATNWRSDYLVHFRRAVEAGLDARTAALSIATDGLASLHDRMRVTGDDDDLALADWTSTTRLATAEVQGTGEAGDRVLAALPRHPAARRRAAASSSTPGSAPA